LKIGIDSINWYKEEIDKYSELVKEVEKTGLHTDPSGKGGDLTEKQRTDQKIFEEFTNNFLK
jgi:Cys-tRNA synthase (O-phospho-L-seryl-tRNA:Cys-tRNA synthase)